MTRLLITSPTRNITLSLAQRRDCSLQEPASQAVLALVGSLSDTLRMPASMMLGPRG